MKLSAGKWLGLRRLADADGRFKITAVDQRPPIQNQIKASRGVPEASWEDVADVKQVLAEGLAAESTALLMDPLFAWPRAHEALRHNQGLMLTLEHAVFEETTEGRRSCTIPDWDVAKIKRVGADGVKLLAWYRPDASPAVCEHQQQFVQELGAECARYDLPFLLELLVYPLAGEAPEALAERKSELVLESVREFARPEFAVDLFKLESPVSEKALSEGSGVQKTFDELGRLAGRPWVMLSAGANAESFRQVLVHAYQAGASGFLAGRAIWWPAFVQNFPDLQAMRRDLQEHGLRYMREINALTEASAVPWTAHPCYGDRMQMAEAVPEFARNYPGF